MLTLNAEFNPRSSHTSVVYNDQILIIGGYDGANGGFNDIWSSFNGINWNLVTSNAAWSARSGHTSVVHNDPLQEAKHM